MSKSVVRKSFYVLSLIVVKFMIPTVHEVSHKSQNKAQKTFELVKHSFYNFQSPRTF